MLKITPGRQDKLTIISICILVTSSCLPGRAQQENARPAQSTDVIADLKMEVGTIAAQQRLMVEQMDELKRQLSASVAGPRALQPHQLPGTIGLHGEPFEGNSTARVVIIEYSDFECPYCGLYERETSPQVFDNYIKSGKVKLYYRDLPLPMHPHAMQAARAARCAGDQGKYWEMHDSLFAKQNTLSNPALLDRAKTLGLDADKFSECFSSEKYDDEIRKSMAEAQTLGIGGTPTFFIGTIDSTGDVVNISKRIIGARPYADFQSALDEVLASKNGEAVSTR